MSVAPVSFGPSLEDLRALASQATPGPWEADGKYIHLGVTARPDPEDHYNVTYWESAGTIYDEGGHTEADAAYIAAASPDRVTALLDENAKLRDLLDRAANEGRNVLPDATDDQATVIEQWALDGMKKRKP